MCLMGCESKQEVVNKYDKIPNHLLQAPIITDRNVTNQSAGVLLIDVYSGYKTCIDQLEAIKDYETKRDKQ